MNQRMILPAVVLLTATVALTGCGGDPDRPSTAAPAPSTSLPAATPAVPAPSSAGPTTSAAAPEPATTPSAAVPPAPPAPKEAKPGPESTSPRLPLSPPPVELPPRQPGAPSAREVVAAFRKAGLKVANSRNRSVECGPDGLGLGCSELIVTDNIAVYVFPDESSAIDIAEVWSGASHRRGTIVLNYLQGPTPNGDRPRYEKALADLH
ncbi:hypothetical protein [Micromonospora sp. DT229]|uniref:hypothetical protein n=1 Tax=Micromonospora sp. DT229 TaxID=3393430 RepID=UPI003CF731D1